MYDDALIQPWFDHAVDRIPGLSLFDAHAHVGSNDPDGFRLSAAELLTAIERVCARTMVTPMHEPGGYSAANDGVMEDAARSDGRLVPFCRVDPRNAGAAEARRCLDAGARGIKLHPRAERFELCDDGVAEIFAIAHERRLPVLVHAGRGIPTLGRDALTLARRFPLASVILAHAGVCDLNWIWREVPDQPNLFFDTAWWHSTDLAALFELIPPGQILYGSDPPYFTPMLVATCVIRAALQAGLTPDQVRVIGGIQLERLLDGKDPLDLGPARGGDPRPPSILLERVNSLLLLGVGRMLLGDSGYEPLALARLACDIGVDDAPETPVCRNVLALLDRAEQRAREDDGAGVSFAAPGAGIVMLAANVSRTANVPLPAIPELATEEAIRSASLAGHLLIDPAEITRRSAEIRRASAIFPTIALDESAPPEERDVRDIRRSSVADHLIVDGGSPPPRDAEE